MPVLDRLSFQLYSAREMQPLERQLDLLQSLGYERVEPFGGLLADTVALKRQLDAYSLSAPSCHVGLDRLTSDFDGAVDDMRTLGTGLVIAPYLQAADRPKDTAGWRALGTTLQGLVTRLKAEGLRFAWHNHDFEHLALPEGGTPMDLILESAPDLLWEADLAWIVVAGEDPLTWLKRYSGRVVAVHVKDIASQGEAKDEDGWADVGHGTLDWSALVPASLDAGAELLVLEHDKPADVERFARRSYETVAGW